MNSMEKPNPNLPDVIIDDILSRLPVKSVLRFRSVSKLWLSSISSPEFIKSHFSKSIENPQLILANMPPNYYLMNCSVNSLLNQPVTEPTDLDFPFKLRYGEVWIPGSCNGLVCLVDEEYLFSGDYSYTRQSLRLWNPSTRKSRRLPRCKMIPKLEDRTYGFGYDEYDDDFKVVVISEVPLELESESKSCKVCIYSLKSDSWKRIEDFSLGSRLCSAGRFVSGALHWTASCNAPSGSSTPFMIVSFDLRKEKFGEVVQPNYGEVVQPNDGDGTHHLALGILGGCLSVVCNFRSIRADVWIMKEYGVKESWTKLLSVPYRDGPVMYECLKPLLATVNGDIMLQFNSHIWLYDTKHKTVRTLFDSHVNDLDVNTFVEGLVSPHL